MALPPFIMTRRPACAASGWLVVTMPCDAITSARLWAAQPSARSPRTAAQAAARGSLLQTDSSGVAWAKACDETVSAMLTRTHTWIAKLPMAFFPNCSFLFGSLASDLMQASRRRAANTSYFGREGGGLVCAAKKFLPWLSYALLASSNLVAKNPELTDRG